jgi:hypothetical protein
MPEHPSGPILEQRLRALELEINDLRTERRRRAAPTAARPSRARRIVVSLSVIMAIGLLPMVALASDTFTDVPNTNQFHDPINNLYNARVTRGCTTTPPLEYCPRDPVNRQQMAGFLNRGLGRATGAEDQALATADTGNIEVASVTIDAGGLTGGTGFVLVTGSVSAFTDSATTCPCEVGMWLSDSGGAGPGLAQFFDVSNTPPTTFRNASGSQSWVFQVPSGTAEEFTIMADVFMTGVTGSLTLSGHITAVYVPFGGTGGSTLGTTSVQGESNSADARGD